jgi:hypothetical protein
MRDRRHLYRAALALVSAGVLAGCKPDLGAPPSLVVGPRVLAVRGNPPEAKQSGDPVTYDTLIVDVDGRVTAPSIGWALCKEPHPPAESNIVSSQCLQIPDDTSGESFTAPIPGDACTNFGPLPSMPGARPADPDVTGGYYQPVRAVWHADSGDETAFALERVLCNIGSIAPTDISGMYATDYKPNNNPTIATAVLDPGAAGTPLFTAGQMTPPPPASVPAGQPITLEVSWTDDAAESFLVYDITSHTLMTQGESLRLSWFATGGVFEHDRTGRSGTETDAFTSTQNGWIAPTTPGLVHLWFVLRDSRGGVDFAEAQIDVTP